MTNRQYNFFMIFFIFFCFFISIFQINNFYFCKNSKNIKQYINNNLKKNDILNVKRLVNIKNDVISVDINLLGGSIEHVDLLKYKDFLYRKTPFSFLNYKKDSFYQVISGIADKYNHNIFFKNKNPLYSTSSALYKLKKNQKNIQICMFWSSKKGDLIYKKKIILTRGSYNIHIGHYIYNNNKKPLKRIVFGSVQKKLIFTKKKNIFKNFFDLKNIKSISYSTDNKKCTKYNVNSIKNNFYLRIKTFFGWIVMQQKYFLVAWIPKISKKYYFYIRKMHDYFISIGFISSVITIAPYSSYVIFSKIWIGPHIQNNFLCFSKCFNLIIDYGWFFFISKYLFQLLNIFFNFSKNWGIAIILITFFIRIITYPLTKMQYISTIKTKRLQPKINKIKKKYFNNNTKINEKILLLYKNEKINPLSSFISFIIQMPIFLSLYYVLRSSIELRHASFFLWIKDLSNYDPYYVLPILTGFSIFFMQKFNNNDSLFKNNNIMKILPFLSIIFFLWFPSGLVLYYFVSNIITIMQQFYIKKFFLKK